MQSFGFYYGLSQTKPLKLVLLSKHRRGCDVLRMSDIGPNVLDEYCLDKTSKERSNRRKAGDDAI